MAFMFEKLDVYQNAVDFADQPTHSPHRRRTIHLP